MASFTDGREMGLWQDQAVAHEPGSGAFPVAAMDRGAPLAQVLQEQAVDAREDAKRALIESAGRKEILMLLPLVFLILPLSVLFAVFPGIVMLKLGIS